MSFSDEVEHSKNYWINLQVFGDRFSRDRFTETEIGTLSYLATSVEIDQSGGSDFVHQKGRTIASAFATQPTISINVKCYMREVEFAVLISAIITEQQQILLSFGKLNTQSIIILPKNIANIPIFRPDNSALVYEAIGFLRNAKISATAGEYVVVDFTMYVDDLNQISTDDIPKFEVNLI